MSSITAVQGPDFEWVLKLRTIFGVNRPIALIPLLVQEKVPAVKWKWITEGGLPPTEQQLRDMWKGLGRPNVGIVTGPASQNIYVVDLDNDAALEWASAHAPDTTLLQKTRFGYHFLYRAPDGKFIHNRADILGSKAKFAYEAEQAGFEVHPRRLPAGLAPEKYEEEAERARTDMELALKRITMGPVVDVRGRGGQIVAPGSAHPKGHKYMWPEGAEWSPELFDEAELIDPSWIESLEKWQHPEKKTSIHVVAPERLVLSEEKMKRANAWIERTPGAIEGQRGHDHTFYVVCRLVNGFGLSGDEAFEMLQQWNNTCQPMWTVEELAHKVTDAIEKIDDNHGFMLADRPEFILKQGQPKSDKSAKQTNPFLAAIKPIYEFSAEEASAVFGSDDEAQPEANGSLAVDSSAKSNPKQSTIGSEQKDDLANMLAKFGIDMGEVIGKNYLDWSPQHKKVGDDFRWMLQDTTNNVALVLMFGKGFKGLFSYDTLKMKKKMGSMPYSDKLHCHMIKKKLDKLWSKEIPKEHVKDAIRISCSENEYDPCADFIKRVPKWDGVDRFSHVVEKIFGNDANDKNFVLMCRMLQNTLVGMMARIIDPGCKMDTVLIMQGDQGLGKTSFFKYLLPNGFTSDSAFDYKNKDGLMMVATHIVIELQESVQMRRTDEIEYLKGFLTTQVDVFRPPYGEELIEVPRRCIFIATSNDKELIFDESGARRFYGMPVKRYIQQKDVEPHRDQILAQALHVYSQLKVSKPDSEEFHASRYWFTPLDSNEHKKYMRGYEDQHPWTDKIADYIKDKAGQTINIPYVITDVIGKELHQVNGGDSKVVAKILRRLGCEQGDRISDDGGRRRRLWTVPVSVDHDDPVDAERLLDILHGPAPT